MAEPTQNSKQNVQAPQAGQTVIVNAIPGQDIVLEAAFDQAEVIMDNGNVIFEFEGGGQVVLNFADLGTAQAPNVVMPDGTILNMEEFLASLGEGDVEPAAGPEAGADGSGGVGEYRDDAGNLIDGTDKLNGLDPREFSSIVVPALEADTIDEEGNPVPAAGIVAGAVDEDGLEEGIGDTTALGDHPAQLPFVEGNLSYVFGGDGPAGTDPFVWSLAGLVDKSVMSQGNVLDYEVVDGVTLNAFYMGYPESDGGGYEQNQDGPGPSEKIIVFTLELTDLETGAYRFELFRPLDHSESFSEDDIVYNFTFTITDGSGDTALGGLNMVVDDDSPIWQSIYASSSALVVEEAMAFEDADNSEGSGGVMSDAALLSSAGDKDQAAIESFLGLESGGLSPLAASGAGSDEATTGSAMKTSISVTEGDEVSFYWTFSTTESGSDVGAYNDFSFFVIDGQAIELADVSMVGSTGVTPWAKFTYTAKSTGEITVGFGVMNTGDQLVESSLKIDNLQVNGQTVPNGGFEGDDLDEWQIEGIVTQVEYNLGDETGGMTGSLAALVAFGADGPGEFSLLTDTSALPSLFSKGDAVQYIVEGNTLIAYVGKYPSEPDDEGDLQISIVDDGGYRVVFTLDVNPDGSWDFDLQDQLDHVNDGSNSKNFDLITGVGEEDVTSVPAIDFSSLIKVTDGDGDVLNGAPTGSFTIAIQDDVPVVTLELKEQTILDGLKVSLDETVGDDRYNSDISEIADEGNDDDLISESVPPKVEALAQVRTSIDGGLAGLFTAGGAVGADEPGSKTSGVLSFEAFADGGGLETTLSVTGGGKITLFLVDGVVIVGRETDDDGNAFGDPVFTIGIVQSPADSGAYQLETTLFRPIDHGEDDNHYDAELPLHLAVNGAVQLKYEVTRSDYDGDTVTTSAMIDLISRATEGEGELEVINKSYFSFDDDGPVVDVSSNVTFTLTVTNLDQWSSAGFSNSFGYYIKDAKGEPTLGGVVIWANVKDSDESDVTIQGYTPDQIGFFIIPDGFGKNPSLLSDNLEVYFEKDDDGYWLAKTKVGDNQLTGEHANVLFDVADLNPDDISHATDNGLPGNLNWEDILAGESGFDNDYNDVNINVRWSSNMPSLVTQDKETIGEDDDATPDVIEGQHTVTAAFAGMFNFSGDPGSDGGDPGLKTYALDVTNSDSGLFSEGKAIVLSEDDGVIEGSTEDGVVFSISVDSAEGTVTLTQFKQIDHLGEAGDGDASNNSENMAYLLDGRISLTATYTIVDGDGDSASDSQVIDISSVFGFEDDVPSAVNVTKTFVEQMPVYISGFQAGFVNADGKSALDYVENDSDSYPDALYWGVTDSNSGSGYSFVDNGDLRDFSANLAGTTFTLGSFSHINMSIAPGTSLNSADLIVNFMLNGQEISHTITFLHDETTNTSDPIASRDIITLLNTTLLKEFEIDGQKFTLNIEGFKVGDDLATVIYTDEGKVNTFDLVASISPVILSDITGTVNPAYGADGPGEIIWSGDGIEYDEGAGAYVATSDYGTFIGKSDGSYEFMQSSYDVNEPVTLDFTYTVVDGDDDIVSAVLNLTITDASEVVAYDNYGQAVMEEFSGEEEIVIPALNDFKNWAQNQIIRTDVGSWGRTSANDTVRNSDGSLRMTDGNDSSNNYSVVVSKGLLIRDSSDIVKFEVDVSNLNSQVDKNGATIDTDEFSWKIYKLVSENWELVSGVGTSVAETDGFVNQTITGLEGGTYRLEFIANDKTKNDSSEGMFSATIKNLSVATTTSVDDVLVYPAIGNVISDPNNYIDSADPWGAQDELGSEGALLTAVNGHAVAATGLTAILGTYGSLGIYADGSYTYTPFDNLDNLGQSDVFVYTLTQPDGDSNTAQLVITIADTPYTPPVPIVETVDGVFIGTEGNDVILGSSGDDALMGGAGDDRLEGGAGDDSLVGGAGDDIMLGGAGSDTFKFGMDALDGGQDQILDFELGVNGDLLDLSEVFGTFDLSLQELQDGGYLQIEQDLMDSSKLNVRVDADGSGVDLGGIVDITVSVTGDLGDNVVETMLTQIKTEI